MNTITFRIGESLKVELPKLDKAVVPTELNQEIRCYARVAVELALASMGTSDAESFTKEGGLKPPVSPYKPLLKFDEIRKLFRHLDTDDFVAKGLRPLDDIFRKAALYECGEEYYTPYVRIKQLAGTALMLENIDLLIPSIDAGMPAVVNTIREQYTYGDSPDEIRFKRSSIEWDIYGEDVEKLKKHLAGRIAAQ